MSSVAAPTCVEVESSDEDVVVEGSIDTDTGEVRRKEGSLDSEGRKEGGKTRRGRRGGGGQKVAAGRQEVDTTQDSCTSSQSTGSRSLRPILQFADIVFAHSEICKYYLG